MMRHNLIRFLAIAALVAFPSASFAETPESDFNIAFTETCLNTNDGIVRYGCIGLSANACQNTETGSSTVGMGFCIAQELEWWDVKLNVAYKKWVAQEKKDDEEARKEGWSAPEKLPELKNMQRAWITYRDALCLHEMVQWGGGTGGGPAYQGCVLYETARQFFVLEDRYSSYNPEAR